MTDQQQKPKITDYGNGPSIYANEIIGVMFDGAAVTLTLGTLEARIERQNDKPKEANISVCGKVTLSPKAAVDAINILNNMLTTLQAQQQKAPEPDHVN